MNKPETQRWRQTYALVLSFLFLQIIVYYLVTEYYS